MQQYHVPPQRLRLNINLITNEKYTLLAKVFDDNQFLKLKKNQPITEISKEHPILFDMGGYIGSRVKSNWDQSKHITIPTTSDNLDLHGTISTINKLNPLQKKIVIILNKIEHQKEIIAVKKLLG